MKKIFFLGTFLVGCSLIDTSGSNNAQTCGANSDDPVSKTAFSETLHPIILRNQCLECHDGVSGKGPYTFASHDVASAHLGALNVVDLSAPENSRIVKKVVGPPTHYCGSPSACSDLSNEMKNQIAAWKARVGDTAGSQCANGPEIVVKTKAVTMKAADFTGPNSSPLRWDLQALSPLFKGSVWLEMWASPLQDANGNFADGYTLTMPGIATSLSSYRVNRLAIQLNDQALPNQNFEQMAFVVAPRSFDAGQNIWNFSQVSQFSQSVLLKAGESHDLSISASLSETTQPPSKLPKVIDCKAKNDFYAYLYNNVLSRTRFNGGNPYTCLGCHTSGGTGFSKFPLEGDDACKQALARSNKLAPEQSRIVTFPATDPAHPYAFQWSTEDIDNLKAWLAKE